VKYATVRTKGEREVNVHGNGNIKYETPKNNRKETHGENIKQKKEGKREVEQSRNKRKKKATKLKQKKIKVKEIEIVWGKNRTKTNIEGQNQLCVERKAARIKQISITTKRKKKKGGCQIMHN
jgi:hypothetical protein